MADLDIRKLFKQRTQRRFKKENQADQWVTDILESNNDTEYYITSKSLEDSDTITDINDIINKGFYVSAIFYCGSIFINKRVDVGLFIFTKNKPEKIRLGHKALQSFNKDNKQPQIIVNTNLPKEYSQYIYEIENWINNNNEPKDLNQTDTFGEIAYNKFLPQENLNPLYYITYEQNNKTEKNAKLSDYAEIIYPKSLSSFKDFKDLNVKVITADEYNTSYKNLNNSARTDTQLKTNDILINNKNEIYLCSSIDDYKTPIYVSPNNQVVLRGKMGINAHALYCILKLDDDLSYNVISPEMPVIEIKEDIDYDELYENLVGKKHSYYIEGVNDDNLKKQVQTCAHKQMEDVVQSDLAEICRCYDNKAYKAAIILCGSVLEAILYDWLKEMGEDIDDNWTLIDYINQIKFLYKPKWFDAATKAHEIRKKRNYIHPKKYVENNTLIDKKLCDNMREYLDYVIKTKQNLSPRNII